MKTTTTTKTTVPARLLVTAAQMLDLDTLDTRNHDALDFHDMSVASIRRVIEMAYQAGRASAK